MSQAINYLKRVSESMERAVEKVVDDHAFRCTGAIKKQLIIWKTRYPRHDFHAWYAHGILAFDVHPPVMGEKSVEYLNRHPGAIGELGKEAQEFLDVWNDMEWKVVSMPLTDIIKIS